MSQSVRTRLLRVPKQEQELRIVTNPHDRAYRSESGHYVSPNPSAASNRKRLTDDDYEAPLTSRTLRPNSHWFFVRRHLHRIRFMGLNARARDTTLPDFYVGLQMKRELKRAQEEIKNIDKEENFQAVKKFTMADASQRMRTYDTSHVKPEDAFIYDRLGEEPLAVQNLLYYFSRQEVAHGTIFWDFLNEVNRVLHMQRKRTARVETLRKLALTLAIIFYSIIGIMLFLLIASVIAVATKMDDPEAKWIQPDVDNFSNNLLAI